MNAQKVNLYISQPRFNRYFTGTNGDFHRAVKLYKANLEIAASFHPVLGILEVSLRNGINQILDNYFNDADWITNQKTGFMSHPTLRNDFLKSSVEKAEIQLQRLQIQPTAGKLIAEQSFGFWTALYETSHYSLLQGRPIQVFQHLPRNHGRREVANALTKIRAFRNRINHNEPICFNGGTIDFTAVEDVYQSVTHILDWIDKDLAV